MCSRNHLHQDLEKLTCGSSLCLYISDLQQFLGTDGVFRIVYADDVQVYIQVLLENLLEGIARLSIIAGRVALWAEQNHLRFNSSKTTAIALGSSHALGFFERLNHQGVALPNGEVVKFENTVKSLGVVLDSALSWKHQVEK